MTSRLLLDTSFVIALEADDDQYHRRAVERWGEFAGSLSRFVATSMILAEVVAAFQGRRRHDKAVFIGDRLMHGDRAEFYHVDESLLRTAWDYLRRHGDKAYSLTDCVSFILMDRLGIRSALT